MPVEILVKIVLAGNSNSFLSCKNTPLSNFRVSQVMLYNFSTAEESMESQMNDDIFSSLMSECNRTTSGPMHGYGFGLPTSRYIFHLQHNLQF